MKRAELGCIRVKRIFPLYSALLSLIHPYSSVFTLIHPFILALTSSATGTWPGARGLRM